MVATFLLFGLPVILGLIGIVLGTPYSETHSVVIGLIGFGAGLLFAKVMNNVMYRNKKIMPVIIEILDEQDSPERFVKDVTQKAWKKNSSPS